MPDLEGASAKCIGFLLAHRSRMLRRVQAVANSDKLGTLGGLVREA